MQTLPLGREPLLERALGQRQPGQQVAAVEASDLLERLGAAIGDQSLEPRHVHIDERRVQGHASAVEDQAGPGAPGQDLPDFRERVTQVAPGLSILHVSPQKGRELLARVGLAERDSQVRQEGLGLPGGKDERSAGFELCLKSPQKREFQACRGLQCSSRVPARGDAEYAIGPHRPPLGPRSLTPFFTLPATIRTRRPAYNGHEGIGMGDAQGSGGMEPTEHLGEYTTLIVRIRQDDAGRLSGVVERARTGEKVQFHGLETLSRAVASLLSTTERS